MKPLQNTQKSDGVTQPTSMQSDLRKAQLANLSATIKADSRTSFEELLLDGYCHSCLSDSASLKKTAKPKFFSFLSH